MVQSLAVVRVRIHQDDIQEKMFEVLGFTKERSYMSSLDSC